VKSAFSIYPAGNAGLALGLLRAAAIATNVGLAPFFTSVGPWLWMAAALTIPFLAIGLMTRAAAAACVFIDVIVIAQGGTCSAWLLASHVMGAAAVALVGPGAWSVDARLFGRRTISLPR